MARWYRVEGFLLALATASSIMILFLLAPIAALIIAVDPKTLEEVFITEPSLSREAWLALATTLKASAASTTILVALGVPLAYLLARVSFKGREVVEALIDVPLMIPHAVAGIMVLMAYGRRGVLGPLTAGLGVAVDDSFWGIVAAMTFVSAPIMVDTVKAGFRGVSPTLEYVARSLGASWWRAFTTVTLPLTIESLVAGGLLSWARAISEVGAILIVAYYPKTINVLIVEWFNTYGLRYAASLSLILVALSLAVFTGIRVVARK